MKQKKGLFAFIVCALFFGIGLSANAQRAGERIARTELSITTQPHTNGILHTRIDVANTGDEFLRDLRIAVASPDDFNTILAEGPIGELMPGKHCHTNMTIRLPQRWARSQSVLPLTLTYALADGRHISSIKPLTCFPEAFDAEASQPLVAGMPPPTVHADDATITVTAASLTGKPEKVRVRIIAPAFLQLHHIEKTWTVPPTSESLQIKITLPQRDRPYAPPVHAILESTDPRQPPYAMAASTTLAVPEIGHYPRMKAYIAYGTACLFAVALISGLWLRRKQQALKPLWTDILVLSVLTALVAFYCCPPELFINTTTVGGDTVAHNYIVSQLKTFLHQGHIVGWAPGWWSGFPLFHYYFCLPYLFANLLDLALPFNIAFKLMCIAGVITLPACGYLSGKILKLKAPAPALLAIATIPLLFDTGHVMWGVNAYSTFAGMIANSWSFSLMILAQASVIRDALDKRASILTILLLSAVVASHFFTSIILCLTLALLPLLPATRNRKALGVMVVEGGMTALLMAWWIVPLILKRDAAIAFGNNWTITLWKQIPIAIRYVALPAMIGLLLSLWKRKDRAAPALVTFSALTAISLAMSILLFLFGYEHVSNVFVNCRLWPFILHGMLVLCALGAAEICRHTRPVPIAVFCCLTATILYRSDDRNYARDWASYNFAGLEATPGKQVFDALVMPLDGTPGRLAYDLHPDNNRLGSSRVFELVPLLTDKPIVEGGLVNSAIGAFSAYTLQGELSEVTAGAPSGLKLQDFDIRAALLHMDMLRVKHVIARSPVTTRALGQQEEWDAIRQHDKWTLFENRHCDGQLVRVADRTPLALKTEDWKQAALDYLDVPKATATPVMLLNPEHTAPPDTKPVSALDFGQWLTRQEDQPWPDSADAFHSDPVREEAFTGSRLTFTTRAVGNPHVIAISWHPNWQVTGANAVYRIAPGLMMVYPSAETVMLSYRPLLIDLIANIVSSAAGTGLIIWFMIALFTRRRKSESNQTA